MNRFAHSRRVDWDLILDGTVPLARIAPSAVPAPQLARLVAALRRSPSPATVDRVLRDAVELARVVLRLERAAIFLLDEAHRTMMGTWGTDDRGRTVDERHIMYAFGAGDHAVFDRAQQGIPWTVYEECPLVSQLEFETRVFGTGWVACTAIQGPRGPLGILFNDAGLTGAPFDQEKQARAAILCALLGPALDRCHRSPTPRRSRRAKIEHPLVRRVTNLLAGDPTLTCSELAEQVHLSAGRLTRTFKRETRTSLVDHRNELRLARFFDRMNADGGNLLEAALAAGFGSYAQFHRVFRARFGHAPRSYLSERSATATPNLVRNGAHARDDA